MLCHAFVKAVSMAGYVWRGRLLPGTLIRYQGVGP